MIPASSRILLSSSLSRPFIVVEVLISSCIAYK
jgi:hypothetical protein